MRVKRQSVIVMHIAMILLCLVLFTAHLSSGMFARYATAANGSDEARAAQYNVEIAPVGSLDFEETDLTPTDHRYGQGTYSFKVTNNSEVPVRYTLDIALVINAGGTVDTAAYGDFNGNGEEEIYERMIHNVQLDGHDGTRGAGGKYTFSGADTDNVVLEIGESKTYTLTLDTDIIARYSDDETGTDSDHWNKTSSATGTKNHWDREWIPFDFDITAKTVQID